MAENVTLIFYLFIYLFIFAVFEITGVLTKFKIITLINTAFIFLFLHWVKKRAAKDEQRFISVLFSVEIIGR